MEIITFFPKLGLGEIKYDYAEKLRLKLAEKNGSFILICAEYSENRVLGAFEGLDIALNIEPGESPILFCSFLPQVYFIKEKRVSGRFEELMSRPRTRFIWLKEVVTPEQWYNEYKLALADKK
jgi:hypothetical protein